LTKELGYNTLVGLGEGSVDEAAFFKATDRAIFVLARGHATAALCPDLKTRIFARLESEPRVERILFDLADCEYMDSTFLGLIVGAHKLFNKLPGRALVLLHVNDTCRGLLRTIGVLSIVELSEESPPFPEGLEEVKGGSKATPQFILDAHEELSGLSEDNRKQFATLTQVLRNALGSKREG
jgi:anti-anti-sigma factor